MSIVATTQTILGIRIYSRPCFPATIEKRFILSLLSKDSKELQNHLFVTGSWSVYTLRMAKIACALAKVASTCSYLPLTSPDSSTSSRSRCYCVRAIRTDLSFCDRNVSKIAEVLLYCSTHYCKTPIYNIQTQMSSRLRGFPAFFP